MGKEDMFAMLVAFSLLVLLVVALIFASTSNDKINKECLERGYPGMIRTSFGDYCIRRINGTDEVVRLDSLKK